MYKICYSHTHFITAPMLHVRHASICLYTFLQTVDLLYSTPLLFDCPSFLLLPNAGYDVLCHPVLRRCTVCMKLQVRTQNVLQPSILDQV